MLCAIYCRLSREDSADSESESIQNQKAMLSDYADSMDWEVYKIYADDDYSGADRSRPEWNAMLAAAAGGCFGVIVCKNLSRFTRDMEIVEKYIHGLFPLWGVRFVAVLDNIDTEIRGNKKARQINGLVNEWYLEDLSENIRTVLDRKRHAGKYIGSRPLYGYKKDLSDHNKLVIHEENAITVKNIFGMYLSGMGVCSIAKTLNQSLIPSPGSMQKNSGKNLWNHTAVTRILKNEMYTGTMVQGKKVKPSYKSGRLLGQPKEKWIKVENTHESIIGKCTFDEVQRLIEGKTRSCAAGEIHLLAGILKCADCGGPMRRISSKYKGKTRAYLQCSAYAEQRESPQCTIHSINLDVLTEHICVFIKKYIGSIPARKKSFAFTLERELTYIKKQENILLLAKKSLYIDRAGGTINLEQFNMLNAELEKDRVNLTKRAAKIKALATPDNLQENNVMVDRRLVSFMIEKIEIGEKREGRQVVNICWRI